MFTRRHHLSTEASDGLVSGVEQGAPNFRCPRGLATEALSNDHNRAPRFFRVLDNLVCARNIVQRKPFDSVKARPSGSYSLRKAWIGGIRVAR